MRGFTLLELLVATSMSSAITLLLMAYFSELSSLSKTLYFYSETLENVRCASYFLMTQVHKTSALYSLASKETQRLNIKPKTAALRTSNGTFYLSTGTGLYSALYFKADGQPRVELAKEVDDLKIQYGVRCQDSSNICQYLEAPQLQDWKQVGSVQITLIFATKNKQLPQVWSFYIAIKT